MARAFLPLAILGALFTSACISAVSESEIVNISPNEEVIEDTRSANQNILTSTDLRYQNMCRAIESGAATSLRRGIRSLQRHPDQRFYNIGVDQLTDLFGDGVFDASAALVSDTFPKFHGKNIQIFAPNRMQAADSNEGLLFLNEQPLTKEIRKITQGDLNNDGVVDLVFFDYGEHDGTVYDGKVVLLLSEGDSYRWQEIQTGERLRIHTGTLMDIDNDGDLDILFGSVGGRDGRRIFTYENAGNGNFMKLRLPNPDSPLGGAWVSLNASDIDGDGYHDLIAESQNAAGNDFGVQIAWGSSSGLFGGVFGNMNVTQLTSSAFDSDDLLMDSIVVASDSKVEIYATFAADNYQAGSKIVRFTLVGRDQISSELLLNKEFSGVGWINTAYPCGSGLRFFSYNRSGYALSNHFR